ncbi:hypothetical protein SAY86_016266 [Trapa natans]|uniref:Uncharacterized protein n=1 Tax=Trapa natans TaxID=22666 RepID=A0AAN7QW69_TRANT|nr:hypothetical protein SAY86_016266 [Trapa natans]
MTLPPLRWNGKERKAAFSVPDQALVSPISSHGECLQPNLGHKAQYMDCNSYLLDVLMITYTYVIAFGPHLRNPLDHSVSLLEAVETDHRVEKGGGQGRTMALILVLIDLIWVLDRDKLAMAPSKIVLLLGMVLFTMGVISMEVVFARKLAEVAAKTGEHEGHEGHGDEHKGHEGHGGEHEGHGGHGGEHGGHGGHGRGLEEAVKRYGGYGGYGGYGHKGEHEGHEGHKGEHEGHEGHKGGEHEGHEGHGGHGGHGRGLEEAVKRYGGYGGHGGEHEGHGGGEHEGHGGHGGDGYGKGHGGHYGKPGHGGHPGQD